MAALETLLQFMGANFDPTVLKARRAFPKIGPLEYGQVRSGALAALKRADDVDLQQRNRHSERTGAV
jgi:hypothetical protein